MLERDVSMENRQRKRKVSRQLQAVTGRVDDGREVIIVCQQSDFCFNSKYTRSKNWPWMSPTIVTGACTSSTLGSSRRRTYWQHIVEMSSAMGETIYLHVVSTSREQKVGERWREKVGVCIYMCYVINNASEWLRDGD